MVGKKRNRLGIASLAAAIIGFLVVEFQPWLPLAAVTLFGGLSLKGLLEAFFEASMVGGFADWFAVSALFKDPLGIRLPHTNILAKNKDLIAEAIPRFLTGFVKPAAITEELRRIDFAAKAAEALSAGGSRGELHAFLRKRAAEYLSSCGRGDEAAAASLERFVEGLLGFLDASVDAPKELSALLAWAKKERFDERAVDAMAEYARAEIGRNRVRLVAIITPMIKRNAGWQGMFIGSGTVERFLAGIQDELTEIKTDKTNDFRRFILSSISAYAAKLEDGYKGTTGERERLETAFRDSLADQGFRRGFSRFVAQILGRLGEDLSRPDGRFIASLEGAEDALAARLSGDEELRAGINAAAASFIGGVIERGRVVEGVTDYLAGLLKSYDARYFVARIEDAVWNDLQYIRVNGSVVGGLVGIAIAALKAALGG